MGAQKQPNQASRGRGVSAKSKSHEEGMGQREMAQCSRQKEEQVSRPDLYKETGETSCSVWLVLDLVCVYVAVSRGSVQ